MSDIARLAELAGEVRHVSGPGTRSIDLGGTIRSVTPDETLASVERFLEPIGITRVADITGLDIIGIPVAISIRPGARHLSVSQGKGVSANLAAASAIMESIEMYHAERVGPPDRIAPWRHLRDDAIRPSTLEAAVRHYHDRDDIEMHWAQGLDIMSGRPTFVPHVTVDLDSTRAHPDTGILHASSNGLASGNCLVEAVVHAACEVIERDANLRFQAMPAASSQSRRLDLDSIDDAAIRDLLGHFAAVDSLSVDGFEITSAVGIPAFRFVVRDTAAWRQLTAFVGTGCHPSSKIALLRAITEAAQTRLTLISGSRDDVYPSLYGGGRVVQPNREPGPRPFRGPSGSWPSIEAELAAVLAALEVAGYEQMVVVDHTDPEFEIDVVKVIVPGLRMSSLVA